MNKQKFVPKRIKTFGGPVSPAVMAGGFAFISGQISTDQATGEALPGSIEEETRRALENVKTMVEDMGATMGDVVRCEVFLSRIEHFDAMNRVYAEFFGTESPPARSAVALQLWGGMLVEISAIVKL